MTGPLLHPGSPEARAVAGIISNRRLVELDPSSDPLETALCVAQYLLTRDPILDVAFVADDRQRRDHLATRLRTRCLRLPGRPALRAMQGARMVVLADSPAKPIRVISPDHTFGVFRAQLLVVNGAFFSRGQHLALHHFDSFRQILIAGNVDCETRRGLERMTSTDYRDIPLWGEVPLEVLLAGVPT